MQVLGIKVEVQYTKALEDGSYKKVCFSADAQLEPEEDRSKAHLALYRELAADLKTAFSGNGTKLPQPPGPPPKKQERKRKGNRRKGQDPEPETKMCPIHNVPMKRWTNENGGSWYSHNDETTGGEWCSGKPKKKGNK